MATVTGYTAEKMQEILNETIKSAAVVGNNLIVTKYDDTTVNLGAVRGPQGFAGPTGDVSVAQLNAAILASETAMGKGLIANKEFSTSAQSYTGQSQTWIDVTGTSLTFTPVPGRYYDFRVAGSIRADGASNSVGVNIALGIRSSTNALVARGVGFTTGPTWACEITGSRIIKAPSDWNTARTYKVSVYATSDDQVVIQSNAYPTVISIVDLGNKP